MIRQNKSVRQATRRLMAMLVLITAIIVPVSAQEKPGDSALTARKVFEKLQSPALEILRQSSRLDMLDYWDVDSVYVVTNALKGESYLQECTPGYLKVSVTPVSTLEIKLLPVKEGHIVMTIYTVGGEGQAKDSRLDFYDAELRELNGNRFFTQPDLKYFFNIPKGSETSLKELREMIPFTTVEYSASPDNDNLSAKLTVADYMNVDDRNIMNLFLRPEIVMQWKGKYKMK